MTNSYFITDNDDAPARVNAGRFLYMTGDRATVVDPEMDPPVWETLPLEPGRYVRRDDRPQRGEGAVYPQVCSGGGRTGATLSFRSPASLARQMHARLVDADVGEAYAAQVRTGRG